MSKSNEKGEGFHICFRDYVSNVSLPNPVIDVSETTSVLPVVFTRRTVIGFVEGDVAEIESVTTGLICRVVYRIRVGREKNGVPTSSPSF